MSFPSLVTAAAAHHWLSAHAGQRALARPLVVLVGPQGAPEPDGADGADGRAAAPGVRESDVSAQGRRVFANWRRVARIETDDVTRPMCDLLEAVLAPLLRSLAPLPDDEDGGDAFDLVAFDDAATRLRALPADLPLLGRGHHVLLVNPRRSGRAGARSGPRAGVDRWLAADSRELPPPMQLFPSRPGRPASWPRLLSRDASRPPRVRTICSVRPARADAARVAVVSRWRDEPLEHAPSAPGARARWRRAHTAIALATVFAQLAEVEAGSPAVIRT